MVEIPPPLLKGPFTLADAVGLGLTRRHLARLIIEGVVEQVARGVYCVTSTDMDEETQFRVATVRVGMPSAICLLSALAYYNVTDAIPHQTWIMVPNTKRTKHQDIKLFRSRAPAWDVGIDSRDGYAITTAARTIADSLANRAQVGTQIAVEAVRRALAGKATTLGAIMDMAVRLDTAHRIRPYIEALS